MLLFPSSVPSQPVPVYKVSQAYQFLCPYKVYVTYLQANICVYTSVLPFLYKGWCTLQNVLVGFFFNLTVLNFQAYMYMGNPGNSFLHLLNILSYKFHLIAIYLENKAK